MTWILLAFAAVLAYYNVRFFRMAADTRRDSASFVQESRAWVWNLRWELEASRARADAREARYRLTR